MAALKCARSARKTTWQTCLRSRYRRACITGTCIRRVEFENQSALCFGGEPAPLSLSVTSGMLDFDHSRA
eukprot:4731931-Pleurochrysis_carterae.AAC.2